MGRLKRSTRDSSSEDDAGLAGWLYTDLLLGLAVVFLAGTAFVVPAISADDDTDAIPTSSTSSTTTTTTIPVEYCTSLYAVEGAQDDKTQGIWLTIRRDTNNPESMVNEFEGQLRAQIDEENRSLASRGQAPIRFEDLRIGLLLVYGGFNESVGETAETGQVRARNEIFPRIQDSSLRFLFDGDSQFSKTILRFFGTKKDVGPNQVGFDVYPYIESPC